MIGSRPLRIALPWKMSAMCVVIDGADAGIGQRPRRVLARRAAAEVIAGNEDLGIVRLRSIQQKSRIRASRLRDIADRQTRIVQVPLLRALAGSARE